MSLLKHKGSRKNTSSEFAPRFMPNEVDLREHHRKYHMDRRWKLCKCDPSLNFIAIPFTGIIEFIDCIGHLNIEFEEC
jgi:hypothetical protein